MIPRPFWKRKIQHAWDVRPIVWLSGVRRIGKTTLAGMIPKARYLNCDLPSVQRRLEDPESFYDSFTDGQVIIFDEVHRMPDPCQLLKIAADAYPKLRILATGSSTLAATQKFKDSLTGRKISIYLPPVLWEESITIFNCKDLDHRLLNGGFPEQLLLDTVNPMFFADWIDSFYARDIQELFSIRNRTGFMNLLRLLIRQSGGMADYTTLAKWSEITRPTVKTHIEALTIAQAVFVLRPWFGGGRRELVRRPKIYAFDTGFVAFINGWESIREDDRGLLWEHLVLDTLRTISGPESLFYWRDKSGREIDFIVRVSDRNVIAIECKINPDHFDAGSLRVFRALYPDGENVVISPRVKEMYSRDISGFKINFHSPGSWMSYFRRSEYNLFD
ncbi:ATP-binding protein [bacterium]|nr:ATP-binding protein [candidate division CSSED10-310 bacterium]